ncbi:helix-turn-helix domain-containing protein [Crateriforma conspicua]|uniref:Helix-turn-helix domain protein n=1 Tax=Crateriforma conspicua TaxID=2527996 RepID=A0A5C5Y4C4_9PLAN|nr:helix-turn-helix domain-containing protein [Crateriforma conspicua]TWT69583.1 Helix-turn-helix domain protein [Crateriforma conspicua]
MQQHLSSIQASRLLGVSRSTVKRMCDEGTLAVVRTPGGHRRIAGDSIRRWMNDRSDTNAFSQPGPKRRTSVLAVERVVDMLIRGHSIDLADAIVRRWCSVPRNGADDVFASARSLAEIMDQTVAPALWEVGSRWESGRFCVYQEHECTATLCDALSMVKQQMRTGPMLSMTESSGHRSSTAINDKPDDQIHAVGCAVGDEQHDVASKMIELVLTAAGMTTRSLGAALPVDSLQAAINDYCPQIVWVTYTCVQQPDSVVQINDRLFSSLRPGQRLVVGGQALTQSLRRQMRFHFAGDSLCHLLDYLVDLR